MTIPVVGHVVVLGYLAAIVASGIENAIVVGGLSALGAALYGLGIPKNSVLQYETDLKADGFLVMARGPAAEVERAQELLATLNPSSSENPSIGSTRSRIGGISLRARLKHKPPALAPVRRGRRRGFNPGFRYESKHVSTRPP